MVGRRMCEDAAREERSDAGVVVSPGSVIVRWGVPALLGAAAIVAVRPSRAWAAGDPVWRTYTYRETTRDMTTEAVYRWAWWGSSQSLRVSEGDNDFECEADASGGTLREHYRNTARGDVVKIVREGADLVFKGRVRDETVDIRRAVGDVPWKASFFFLRAFALGDAREKEFYIAIPSGKLASRMRATKQPRERLTLPIGSVDAVPVLLTAPGIPAFVWSSRCWYRTSDGLLVRFVGRRGPPGTPPTTSELIREE